MFCVYFVSILTRLLIFWRTTSSAENRGQSSHVAILGIPFEAHEYSLFNACIPMLPVPCHTVAYHYRSLFFQSFVYLPTNPVYLMLQI